MALELTIMAPVILAFIALFIAYDHHDQVVGVLEGGSRDAARAASQSRSGAEVDARVQEIARQAFDQAPPSCRATQSVVLTPANYPQPDDVDVTVTLRCSVTYNDLGWPLIPGSVDVTRSFTSPKDAEIGILP
jgi:Flp pilus assembly protein TadG